MVVTTVELVLLFILIAIYRLCQWETNGSAFGAQFAFVARCHIWEYGSRQVSYVFLSVVYTVDSWLHQISVLSLFRCPSSQHLYKSGQANKSGYFHAFRPMMSNEPVDPHQLALKTIQRMQQQKHQMPIASVTAPSGTVAAQRSLINSRHTGMSSTAASPPSPQTQI